MRALLLLVLVLMVSKQFKTFAQDRPQLADLAARQTLALYNSGGLIALITNSRDCHKYLRDKFYCIYMDTAAHQIDRSFSKAMSSPLNPYFDFNQSGKRIRPILISAGMNAQEVNDFLRLSYALVELALDRNAND